MDSAEALRTQLARQVAHWRAATITIDDTDNFASAQAWAGVESYLNIGLRRSLQGTVTRVRTEIEGLAAQFAVAQTMDQLRLVRNRLIKFRNMYAAVETTLDFYGDAINTRTNPKLASILRTLDLVAGRSMETVLSPLGRETPPVIIYVDKGMGASILRAGVRLWDGGTISPCAAIKITRHNLYRPTSLIHETGHQVAHILGWTEEFISLLQTELSRIADRSVIEGWCETASEIVADIFAFVHCGYGAVAALHDVVASEGAAVLRYIPGDPHPIPYLRVLLNAEFCRRMYGAGPWDALASSWRDVHDVDTASPSVRPFLNASSKLIPTIADICLTRPMRAFGGRSIADIVDPVKVRPDALLDWSKMLGPALATSPYWAQAEPVRLLALFSLQMAIEPQRSAQIAEQYESWTQNIGRQLRAAA